MNSNNQEHHDENENNPNNNHVSFNINNGHQNSYINGNHIAGNSLYSIFTQDDINTIEKVVKK